MHNDRIPRRTTLAALALPLLVTACGTTTEPEPERAVVEAEQGARARVGDLLVEDAWMPEPANPEVGVVYVSITNDGEYDDALTSVSTDASPQARMHTTRSTESGASVMREVGEVPVPAGETTELESGGFHIMVNDIPEPLEVGDTVAVTLGLKGGAEVELEVPVREMTGGEDDHGDHADHH